LRFAAATAALAGVIAGVVYAMTPVGKGSVVIDVEPPEAMIQLDGRILKSGMKADEIPAGKHELRIIHNRFEHIVTELKTKANEETHPEKFVLQRALRPLTLESVPQGLPFELADASGTIQTGTTPAKIERLPVGEYTVAMTHEGRK
jgi:hypothetical protein